MQQSKIVRYIRDLSPLERDHFRQFVHSPYFNQHESTIALLEIILESMNGDSDDQLEKKRAFKRLFPDTPFEEQMLHNVLSYLKKLYHRFLAQRYFEKQPFLEQLFTVEEAYDSQQFSLFTNRAKQLNKKLSKEAFRDGNYHFTGYRLHYLMGSYLSDYVDRARTDSFQSMLDHLDQYYIVEKLKQCSHLTANMIMMNTSYQFNLLEPLLEHIRDNWELYRDKYSVVLYYTVIMSLREENQPEHYRMLKILLTEKSQYLSPSEGEDLYNFSYNYCIQKINHGHSEYQRELFQLYKQGLKNGMLMPKGSLSEWHFKNITTLGCSLKEFEWTERFLQDFYDKLPTQQRENAYNYNLATLYYHKGMYQETISTLLHVQFTDVKYHLNTTFLLLRTYYALHDTEALLSLIETFRIYIIRNRKMTNDQKRGYTNFLRFARRLVLLKHQSAAYSRKALSEQLENLSEKIQRTENVINRYWLVQECQRA